MGFLVLRKRFKTILSGTALLFLTLYLPVAFMAYCPCWYRLNCHLHGRCQFFGQTKSLQAIDQLTGFLIHKEKLPEVWHEKERLHLEDVRDLLDKLALAALLSVGLLIIFFNRSKMSTFSKVNICIVLSLLLILPFFKTFWVDVFHPFLFDNDLWRTDFRHRSYYIMPRVFFQNSLIMLVFLSSALNGIIWLIFKKWFVPNSNPVVDVSKIPRHRPS